nr:hypothetical protein [uncultured bacterium]
MAESGTVNAEVSLDGKPVEKVYIDRNVSRDMVLDVTNVRELTIKVDNANGKAWWDWFFVSVQSMS